MAHSKRGIPRHRWVEDAEQRVLGGKVNHEIINKMSSEQRMNYLGDLINEKFQV